MEKESTALVRVCSSQPPILLMIPTPSLSKPSDKTTSGVNTFPYYLVTYLLFLFLSIRLSLGPGGCCRVKSGLVANTGQQQQWVSQPCGSGRVPDMGAWFQWLQTKGSPQTEWHAVSSRATKVTYKGSAVSQRAYRFSADPGEVGRLRSEQLRLEAA